jgi:drug/metabolite transporter (DMT)-like permease
MDGSGKRHASAPSGEAETRAPAGSFAAIWRWLCDQPYLLLALTCLMWGGNAVASRLAVGHISPMALTSLRWVGVCLVLVPVLGRGIRAEWPAVAPHWRLLLLMASLGFTAFNALMYAAAHYTTGVNLTILQGSIPAVVLVGGLLWFGTPVRTLQILGMGLTFLGVLTVAARGDWETLKNLAFNFGDVLMVLACTAYGIYTLSLRKRPKVSGFVFFTVMAAIALVLTLPLLAWEVAAGTVLWPDATGWAVLVYVALFPSLLAQIFFMRGVELLGPARAGLFVNLVPIFGAILAVVILGEPFRLYHALALTLVLGGIWLAERRRV